MKAVPRPTARSRARSLTLGISCALETPRRDESPFADTLGRDPAIPRRDEIPGTPALLGAPAILLALAIPIALTAATPALGQQPIPDEPLCARCTIELQHELTLAGDSLGHVIGVSVDGTGRFWVLSHAAMPVVFDEDGTFIRTVGRPGDGPGEMRRPTGLWPLPGDSVAIDEMAAARLHVFGPDLTFARTVQLPTNQIWSLLIGDWPRTVVVDRWTGALIDGVLPFHTLDLSVTPARVTSSFGDDDGGPGRDRPRRWHALTAAAGGGFWAARSNEYTITRWSWDGQPLVTLERRPDWFAGFSSANAGGPDTPPSPHMSAIFEDEAGRLWTFARVPSPDWRRAWSRLDGPFTPEVDLSLIDWEFLYHTRVEVLDPVSRRVVARRTIDGPVTGVLPDGRVAVAVITTPALLTNIAIVRLRLEGL